MEHQASCCGCVEAGKAQYRRLRPSVSGLFLLIEFFDELVFGFLVSALPVLRTALGLGYAQVGLLLGLPAVFNLVLEPVLLLVGDTPRRKALMVGGGIALAVALGVMASARGFQALLIGLVLAFPASGAFVTLSQASLMDRSHGREPQAMARWTLAGSLGNLVGPLLLAAGLALGASWRWGFAGLAVCGLLLTFGVGRMAAMSLDRPREAIAGLLRGLRAIATPGVLRWVGLLKISDLMLDILLGYAALYLTDVVGLGPARASLVMAGLMAAGLMADFAAVPLLERVSGRVVVRVSSALVIVLFTGMLLVPEPLAKVTLLLTTRLVTLGWYPVLQGEAYASAGGRSATLMALVSVAGVVDGGLAWAIGWTAGLAGLPAAMALMLAAPFSLLLFVPARPRGVEYGGHAE